MERCDFSSVMTIVRRFISDDYNTNQTELLGDVFSSFFNQPDDPGCHLIWHWSAAGLPGRQKSARRFHSIMPNSVIVKNWQRIWRTVFCPLCMTVQWLHRKCIAC